MWSPCPSRPGRVLSQKAGGPPVVLTPSPSSVTRGTETFKLPTRARSVPERRQINHIFYRSLFSLQFPASFPALTSNSPLTLPSTRLVTQSSLLRRPPNTHCQQQHPHSATVPDASHQRRASSTLTKCHFPIPSHPNYTPDKPSPVTPPCRQNGFLTSAIEHVGRPRDGPARRRRLCSLSQGQNQMRLRKWSRSLQELRKGHARLLPALRLHEPRWPRCLTG